MFATYINFLRAVAANRIGRVGVVLTTSSFLTFLFFEGFRLLGVLTNAYIGLITYLLFPVLFVVGLLLVPIGWRQLRKETGQSAKELLSQRFGESRTGPGFFGSRAFMTIGLFTLANVMILSVAGSRMLGFMDEPVFCGTACHSVMNPEWVTYQQSPHARVKCVDCHVGEGVDALVDSKLNGMWQMVSVTFNLLERPIPTPVHQLRPARETCEKCHWPDKFYGSKLKTLVRYDDDSASTPRYTTLNLKIDPGHGGSGEGGIHWHIAAQNEVRYASVNDEREEMIWVEVRQTDGSYKRYSNLRLTEGLDKSQSPRTLDCVDCHNRATHVYEDPHDAVDQRLQQRLLPGELPYIKREGLAAILPAYPSHRAADEGIRNHLSHFYQLQYPKRVTGLLDEIDSAAAVLSAAYRRNIHPGMNITWGTYPSHIGHRGGGGCFRCHNANMVATDGSAISSDCSMCHSILASGSSDAFEYIGEPDSTSRDYLMHQYLREEFLEYMRP